MQRIFTVFHALGLLLVVFSAAYLMPMAAAWIYDDGTLIDFTLAMVMTSAAGVLMWMLTRRYKGELSIRHGYLLVVGMWTAMPAVATLPLLMVLDSLSFTDAYFETMSGITTTGATVLSGLDHLPKSINLWRHQLNWMGGMGIMMMGGGSGGSGGRGGRGGRGGMGSMGSMGSMMMGGPEKPFLDPLSVRLAEEGDPRLEVAPVFGQGSIPLLLRGEKIRRLAIFNMSQHRWDVQELREPVKEAKPVSCPLMTTYALGRRLYTYSMQAGKWSILELPEGAAPEGRASNQGLTLRYGGKIHIYNVNSGEWTDFDLRATPEESKKE